MASKKQKTAPKTTKDVKQTLTKQAPNKKESGKESLSAKFKAVTDIFLGKKGVAAPTKAQKEKVVAVLAKEVAKEVAKGKTVAAKTPKSKAAYVDHGEKMCRESGCENIATTKGFCRLDYIKNWKKIKRKEMILKEGKLNQYIEELVTKYPDKYMEIIRQDLSSEVSFNKVIHDLELDESIDDLEYDGDSIDNLIGSIRKDSEGFEDDEF